MMRRWVIGLLALCLVGCAASLGSPPQSLVERAVAMQAETAQANLWQTLAPSAEAPTLSVTEVKIDRRRRVSIAPIPTYAVTGTYRFEVRYPSRRVRRAAVPFSLLLQPLPDGEHWRIVGSEGSAQGDRVLTGVRGKG